jgi:glycosyltransferase involved in cell wall biosynthesis
MKLLIIAPFDLQLRDGTSIRVTNLTKATSHICKNVFLVSQTINEELRNISNVMHIKIKSLQARYHLMIAFTDVLSPHLAQINAEMVYGKEFLSILKQIMNIVDVVHVHWLIFKYVPDVVKEKKDLYKKPVITDLHGLYRLQPLPRHSLKLSLMYMLSFVHESIAIKDKAIDAFTVPSEGLKHYLTDAFGISPNRVFVVPDAVDEEIIEFAKRCEEIDEDLNKLYTLPSDFSNVIAYSGTISVFHGFPDLVKAIRIIEKIYHKDVQLLLIVPDKKQISKFRQLLPRNTIVLENVPRKLVPCILRKASVLVLPHRAGTQFDYIPSNKIYDYMLAGRPIVAYETPAIAKTLEAYPMKIFAKANDPHELAQGIIQALELWSATEPKPMFNVPTIRDVEKALDSAYRRVLRRAA